ncbi:MAG: hypothetical protein QMD09_14065, partial [Desulfatibacillaceae bacterium]|nr:hypothetical protein [Desulfatibacillaceae bacterium]
MKRILALALMVCIVFPVGMAQASRDIFVTQAYVLKPWDSKNDAKIYCLVFLQQRVAQEVAAYAKTLPRVKELNLTDEALVYAAPRFYDLQIIDERFAVHEDEQIMLTMSGKAVVRPDELAFGLETLAGNPQRMAQVVSDQQMQWKRGIAPGAGTPPPGPSPTGLEPAYPAAPPQRQTADAFISPIPASGETAAESGLEQGFSPILPARPQPVSGLRSGMTYQEMIALVGLPSSKTSCEDRLFYLYGDKWVYLAKGRVVGYILIGDWQGPCH